MGNEMQFSLGLAAGQFLSSLGQAQRGVNSLAASGQRLSGLGGSLGLGQAQRGLTSFIGAGLRLPVVGTAIAGLVASVGSLGGVIQGTFGAFEKGAELDALHQRTGETIGDLFKIEKGFKAGRVAGDAVAPMLFNMQKALGGFNEMGEPTKDIFKGIGLSVEELKKAKAPEQLAAIFNGLSKLNNSEAATAAGKIFGRAGAGDALQLARSGNVFTQGMAGAEKMAAVMERNAAAFGKISQSLAQVKGRLNSFFLGVAEGAAPGIQSMLDRINKIDLTEAGQRVGQFLGGLGEAWKQNQFGELVGLSLMAGFEKSVNYLGRALQAIISALPAMFEAAGKGKSAIGDSLVSAIFDFENIRTLKKAEGLPMGPERNRLMEKSRFYAEIADQGRAEARQEAKEMVEDVLKGATEAAKSTKYDVLGTFFQDALKEKLAQLNSGLAPAINAANGSKGFSGLKGSDGVSGKLSKAAEANSLERVGLLLSRTGGMSRMDDYSKDTSANTRQMVAQQKEMIAVLKKIPFIGSQFIND